MPVKKSRTLNLITFYSSKICIYVCIFLGFNKGSGESANRPTHSRNHSDGSGSSQQGIPTGTRVAPLGRETTPTPNGPQRIPREVWDRFEGKSREVCVLCTYVITVYFKAV